MPDQSDPAGPERSPQCQLLLACRGARQQQIGDVRAGNQQDERDRREQDDQDRPDFADDLLVQRHDVDAPSGILCRKRLLELLCDSSQLSLRLLHAHPRLEPGYRAEIATGCFAVIDCRIEAQRHPGFDLVVEKMKARRHHTDNCALPAIDSCLLADNLGIGAKARLPQLMTDNDHEIISDHVFRRQECATHHRLHAQGGKETETD